MLTIHIGSVVLAAAAAFILGFLIHGPLFGTQWMKLAGIHPTGKEKFSDMIPQMVKNFIANIITAYILSMFIFVTESYYGNLGNVVGGMGTAFWAWLGFVVMSSSMDVIWMGKSAKLWGFEIASSFVCFLAMGAILALGY